MLTLLFGLAVAGVHADHREHPPVMESRTLLPRPPTGDGRPDVIVYGYLSYWAGSPEELPYDRLTHVAVFGPDMTADGGLSGTSHWTSVADEVVGLGAPYGVRVHLTLGCFDADIMRSVFPDSARRERLVDTLGDLLEAHGGHGVSVDCEGMPASLREDFVVFLGELRARVGEVAVALPSVDWSDAYDYAGIARNADQLFIMGYGYHWSGGNPGPVAPLYGGGIWSTWSLSWSVEDYLDKGVPPEQIVLGLPLYGIDWPSTSTSVPGSATARGSSVVLSSAVVQAESTGRNYDSATETPYTFPSSSRQLWYDDTESIQAKTRYAVAMGLGGIGFWALAYEGDNPEFWTMIAEETDLPDPVVPDTGRVDTATPDSGPAEADGGGGSGEGDAGDGASSSSDEEVTEPLGSRFPGKVLGCHSGRGMELGSGALVGLVIGALRRRQKKAAR
jgi:hypothetical protein